LNKNPNENVSDTTSGPIYRPVVLIILDGWGVAPAWGGNAISLANTPFYNYLITNYPNTLLRASGYFVGLPDDEMGNSEVGHLNLGAGRVVPQDSTIINNTIQNNSFFNNPEIKKVMDYTKEQNSRLHLVGLLSDAGVHAQIEHIFALLEFAKREKVEKVFLHLFTDGRDTDSTHALVLISRLEKKIAEIGVGEVVSIVGRYYAMDRDNHWDRIQKAYLLLTQGQGINSTNPLSAISYAYSLGYTDEFIPPLVINNKNSQPKATIQSGDAVIFFNFRADRARELTQAFLAERFEGFKRPKERIKSIYFLTMIPYGGELEAGLTIHNAFGSPHLPHDLAELVSTSGHRQFHLAETEKYAHVTYFFNGGQEEPYAGEDRKMVPSPQVATYDLKPEMSANLVSYELIKALKSDKYNFILTNYANPDMVGHTGNLEAAVRACEVIDQNLAQVIPEALQKNYQIIVTADHGNIEQMVNPRTGLADTQHTTNPVPIIFINNELRSKKIPFKANMVLGNVAPSILKIINLAKPAEMIEPLF